MFRQFGPGRLRHRAQEPHGVADRVGVGVRVGGSAALGRREKVGRQGRDFPPLLRPQPPVALIRLLDSSQGPGS